MNWATSDCWKIKQKWIEVVRDLGAAFVFFFFFWQGGHLARSEERTKEEKKTDSEIATRERPARHDILLGQSRYERFTGKGLHTLPLSYLLITFCFLFFFFVVVHRFYHWITNSNWGVCFGFNNCITNAKAK